VNYGDYLLEGPIRKLIQNERGQFTITLPVNYVRSIGAKKGDKIKCVYRPRPKDKNSFNTITLVWMGC